MNELESLLSGAKLQDFDERQTKALCAQIRAFLIQSVSETGGHIASNLGVVELTVALHKVFDTSKDRLVFDVGHQSYVHKLLTGRGDRFPTLRQYGGMAGFPKPCESVHDAFIAGHASNAVSVALGMARARTLQGEDYSVVALMGDGALTGGLAYEGLNDAGESGEPLIVILNDNGMSITPNVGGMAKHLSYIRTRSSYYRIKRVWRAVTGTSAVGKAVYRGVHRFKEWLKHKLISSNTFNDMGFEYFGPVDGHDVEKLTYLLRQAREMKRPVLLHVITKKGKGFPPAEQNPDRFHGVPPYDVSTGLPKKAPGVCFSDSFGDELTKLADGDSRVCAVTAAMQSGTGLDGFAAAHPERFFDVGIAEGHAVSMAAGLAKQGMLPVAAIYSTFLQRAFDMLIHDVAILGLHVVLGVDRAGLVGSDGETHHGVFDVGYLRQVPGMQILSPSNQKELRAMLRKAVLEMEGPVAVRYPRGGDGAWTEEAAEAVIRPGREITICAYGVMINEALAAAELLEREGVSAEVVKLGQIWPLREEDLNAMARTGRLLLVEQTPAHGGIYDACAAALEQRGVRSAGLDLGWGFVTHGDNRLLLAERGLTEAQIAEKAKALCAERTEP